LVRPYRLNSYCPLQGKMAAMNFQKYLIPAAAVAVLAWATQTYGWAGFALVSGGLMMWILMHFTRAMQVLKRAAKRPIGHVDSAVMLNAKLKSGVSLLHVVALTKSLGALQSAKDTQPEFFRWTDASASHVTCEFRSGKLFQWTLERPPTP
jgi:hypothetical protein